jgi:hypothetical protein
MTSCCVPSLRCVRLTTYLVNRFISLSTSLADSLNVKLVDVWMMFCLTLPLVEVTLQTYLQVRLQIYLQVRLQTYLQVRLQIYLQVRLQTWLHVRFQTYFQVNVKHTSRSDFRHTVFTVCYQAKFKNKGSYLQPHHVVCF